MIVVNIDNTHLITHRYGWHKIVASLSNYIKSDILVVDYMCKYFNLFFDFPKTIICDGKEYNFINKDSYYYINDINKSDVFIHTDDIKLYHILKWFPEYNEFKKMRGEIIQHFKKKNNVQTLIKPWVGIMHYPEFIEEMNYKSFESLPNILKSQTFLNSVKHCKCIVTLSQHLKNYALQELKLHGLDIPIEVIFHPTDFTCTLFSMDKYNQNNNKSIIQIGFWMRKLDTIYNINTTKFKKQWLPGGKYWKDILYQTYPNANEYLADKSVEISMFLSNDIYDNLLTENIILLDVFNSSANNTVLECIARNTPLLVTKHPAIIEYMGVNYPLYFTDITELNNIINSDSFYTLIEQAHNYLANMNKIKFTLNYFCEEFAKVVNKYENKK